DVGKRTGGQSSRAAAAHGKRTRRQRLTGQLRIQDRGVEVFYHQITADSVGVDGPIQVAPPVEVVGQTECIPVPQIALNTHVRLLRVGVNEIRRLRISEWLKAEWQESRLRGIGQVEV